MWCWKVLLQLELPKPDKQSIMEDSVVVGMDLNVSNFLVDSEGREIQNLKTILTRKDLKTMLVSKFVEVELRNTTRSCSNLGCGNEVDKELLSRVYECRECGLEIDRDLNAATNIVSRGYIGRACLKSEPLYTLASAGTSYVPVS
ncbi:MAG: IS605 OrfB-like transposable element containing RNAse H-like and Zn finger domain [Candidatus Methanohalarchaeum thermophilum]|uniref:IS605 OrfB-like transposable element containing RNAse H-like and Zn finger domain n=1 Tax=Methanohalarchaeum thermophilum TaxID=1903181 RepID=A0A1Q6DXB4_METT1|nr:MAG: IS605 OrfB-like transposable element containing RNAse H-like and Zn finger domain [Candidatus Methanohalarchaeum thermophilum]